jgi:acylphosphatase
MPASRFLVTGKVQGVFFRASTRIEADRLGLDGYARNLPDGRVEVLVVGAEDAVRELGQWLQRGPPQARVDTVECETGVADALTGHFSIR